MDDFIERKIKKYNTCFDLISQMEHILTADGMFMGATLIGTIEQLKALLYWELSRANLDYKMDKEKDRRSW